MKPLAKRGNVATIFAICLVMLLAFVALVVDISHYFMVQGELQNGADAAALAAARDLDGTAARFTVARTSAQHFGLEHDAYQTPIALQANLDNAPTGNIVLGSWDFGARAFTPADTLTPAYKVNAVQVVARRTAGEGGAVAATFGAILGKTEQGITATAVAVGGSPGRACGFPLAVADCSILAPDSTLRCNQTLTFGQATTDTVGFTVYADANPTTPSVTCYMARDLGSLCPANCDCSTSCNGASTADGNIRISNGNNLSETSVDNINNAVLLAGEAGVFVEIAVIDSGGLSPAACGGFNYNQPHELLGFVEVRLTGATFAPDKSVSATIDCTHTETGTPGGAFFGLKSKDVYLVK